VGAKGRSAAAAIFLGSVTEKLLRINYDIPVLIVKEKGKHFTFLDFINNI
jgi:nucleotide-binding universal stress UspA family protein